MSDEPISDAGSGLVIIPLENTTPEERAVLSVYYKDDAPVLVVTNGTHVPVQLTVTDASGATIATYTVDQVGGVVGISPRSDGLTAVASGNAIVVA
ncbi:hypothetical protein ABIA31_004212 [Catenulispora sp. MAP5-51]|uniref:hypothetical protein n=1 Tax=Catenulispora sp. MAP5-51 TaxID=3156298 RepID=UPI0035167A55